jgi:hypothetical protein
VDTLALSTLPSEVITSCLTLSQSVFGILRSGSRITVAMRCITPEFSASMSAPVLFELLPGFSQIYPDPAALLKNVVKRLVIRSNAGCQLCAQSEQLARERAVMVLDGHSGRAVHHLGLLPHPSEMFEGRLLDRLRRTKLTPRERVRAQPCSSLANTAKRQTNATSDNDVRTLSIAKLHAPPPWRWFQSTGRRWNRTWNRCYDDERTA